MTSHRWRMLHILAVLVVVLLQLSLCNAGDPCPPKAQLAPCTCSQVPIETSLLGPLQPVVIDNDTSSTLQRRRRALPFRGLDPRGPVPMKTEDPESPSDLSLTVLPVLDNGTYSTIVSCKVTKSLQALEETVSSALNRKLVDKLIVENVPPEKEQALARLPKGWLKKVRVRQFQILNTKLSGDFIWYGTPFEGQEKSLLWFAANKCILYGSLTYETGGTVNTKGLDDLPYIQGVDLSDNYLTYIMASSFKYPPANLSTVILSRNSIQAIENGIFRHTARLRYVDLSHNLLETIARGVFASPAKSLEFIDLSWNSLTTLPPDLFNNMPALKSVNISNNFLYSVPEKPWSGIWRQLTLIDVTDNFIDCNCDLLWLLHIVTPQKSNGTSTAVPQPLEDQTVLGSCTKTTQPKLLATKYDLVTLTRDSLDCEDK